MKTKGGQRKLVVRHVVAGNTSVMLALSSQGEDFDGGGHKFDVLNDPLHLDKGGKNFSFNFA